LSVASCATAILCSVASGSLAVATLRRLSIAWLKTVGGARLKTCPGRQHAAAGAAQRAERGERQRRRLAQQVEPRAAVVRSRGREQLHRARRRFLHGRGVVAGCGSLRGRLGIGIEQRLRQHDPGGAVDGRVVQLRIQGIAAVGQALDQEELPQRPPAVEPQRVQAGHGVLEFPQRARRRQPHPLQVVRHVDAPVRPQRIGKCQRQRAQPPREHGRAAQAGGKMTAHGVEEVAAAGRGIEQVQRADVHRRVRGLEVEPKRVDRAQRLHVVGLRVVGMAVAPPSIVRRRGPPRRPS